MTPAIAPAPARTRDTREGARTQLMLEPAESSSLPTGPSIQRPPPQSGTLCRPPSPSPTPPTQPPTLRPFHLPPPPHPFPAQHPPSRGKNPPNRAPSRPHRRRLRHSKGPRSLTNRYRPSGPVTHPSKARARSQIKTQDHRPAATQTRRRTTAPASRQTQAQTQAWRHNDSANPAPRGQPLQSPAPAIPDPAAAAPSKAPPHRHRRRRYHLYGGTRNPGQLTAPDRSGATPEPTSSVPVPARLEKMLRYRRPRRSQPDPKAKTVSAYAGSAYAHASAPHAHTRHRTTGTPPGLPPPPVPMTRPHTPNPMPTPPPKATAPPMDIGGSAGPTRSSWSCESGPRQSPPSMARSTGPTGDRRRTAASSRQENGCCRPRGKPCWPMRFIP